jgi:hypothetical protein
MTDIKMFLSELADLMEKWGVEIYADDEYKGFAECGEDIQISIESMYTQEYEVVKLGNYIDPEMLKKYLDTIENP